jgi:predicted Rdx family selenoprotein
VAELNGLGHVAEMAEGAKSQFDVLADGDVIFSKQQTGHFPELDELVALLPSAAA